MAHSRCLFAIHNSSVFEISPTHSSSHTALVSRSDQWIQMSPCIADSMGQTGRFTNSVYGDVTECGETSVSSTRNGDIFSVTHESVSRIQVLLTNCFIKTGEKRLASGRSPGGLLAFFAQRLPLFSRTE